MQKIDAEIVARTLAYCEAHADTDDEAAIVHWVAEHIGDAIKRQHPRFNAGAFQVEALPIRTSALRAQILKNIDRAREART